MPDKVTLSQITAGYGSVDQLNANFTAIENWINDKGLDITGTGTNTIAADIDMNGYSLLNLVLTNDGWDWKGDWATSTAYVIGDVVFVTVSTDATNGGSAYICVTDHTSGTFNTDYNTSNYWELVAQRGAAGATGSGTGDLLASNNLSDVSNLTTAFENLLTAHGTLDTADITDDAITLAKMASGTAGNLITYDASGNPAAVATGTSGHILTSNGAGAAPTFQANSAAISQATSGAIAAETDEDTYVPPDLVKHSPGAAKAWCFFDGTSASPHTLTDSHNIASITSSSDGEFAVTFTTAMANANYVVIASSLDTTDDKANMVAATNRTTAGFDLKVLTHDNSYTDDDEINFVVYGDI